MKKTITIEVDDNWEPGCCYDCPLSYEEYYYDDDDDDWAVHCVFHSNYWECPLREEEKR